MLCPFCSYNETKVVDSRDAGDGVRRRRECLRCGLRFTTYEHVQTRSLLVIKRDERREEYNRDKLWASLTTACTKRPLPIGSVEKIVDEIEIQLAGMGRAEIPSRVIGEMVMETLRGLDRVAYIRFASVYRDFRDIESFQEEIDELLEPRRIPEVPNNQLSFLKDDPIPITPRRRVRRTQKPNPNSG